MPAPPGGLPRARMITLVAPMYGGGAEVRTPDPVCPVRPTAVRGQLRFWWRATRGRRFAYPAAVRRRIEELSGSPGFGRPVRVGVTPEPGGRAEFVPAAWFARGKHGGDVLFGTDPQDRPLGTWSRITPTGPTAAGLARRRAGRNKVRSMAEKLPDATTDGDAASAAWVNPGGGRTRRGSGGLPDKATGPACRRPAPAADLYVRGDTRRPVEAWT